MLTENPTQASEDSNLADELRELIRDIVADTVQVSTARVERPLNPVFWSTLHETGLARLTGSASVGGSEAGWAEAAAVLGETAAAGIAHPLLEHDLLAGWLRDAAGLPDMGTPLSTSTTLSAPQQTVAVPWLSKAETLVVLDTSAPTPRVEEVSVAALDVTERMGTGGEPRDVVYLSTRGERGVPVSIEVALEWKYRGALGRAVQMAGAAEGIADLCVEYVGTREQFGRPIGKFQAVQGLVTDVVCEAALMRTIVDRAVRAADDSGFADARTRFLIATAKACTGGASETVIRKAHQLHGAIGTTLEHGLQQLTRPLLEWRREFGSTVYWEAEIEDLAIAAHDNVWELISQ